MNSQVSQAETQKILKVVESCLQVEGDFVELGCYKGETSVLLGRLLKAANDRAGTDGVSVSAGVGTSVAAKQLWLYDSFAGLPEKSAEDASSAGDAFKGGELLATKNEVILKFKKAGLRVPRIKKAFFEDLTDVDLPSKIAFAFLDGDLYRSIKTSLRLVRDKVTDGGVIIVHDYDNPQLPGAAKAVDEFIHANPQYLFERNYSLGILRKCVRRQKF